MKQSFYNHIEDNGTNYALYNCRTDELVLMNPDLKRLWTAHAATDVDALRAIHPTFYAYLCEKGFLVDDALDEVQDYIDELARSDRSGATFSIYVNPTLDCNMRCWYCYEKHRPGTAMPDEVRQRVERLIERKVAGAGLRQLNLSFFGGEPLMEFDTVVWPLLNAAVGFCEAHGKALAVHFTSNAYLLTPERIARLASLRLTYPVSWQITLDGGRAVHNRVRHTAAREATYDTIVRNIHALLQAGMSVLVRLNYQYANLLSFLDVIDDFKDVDEKLKPLLSFHFQQIWQDRNNTSREEIITKLERIEQAYKETGLQFHTQRVRPTRCYADNEYSIVVNYDGNLFRCTAQDFVTDSREGILSPEGELQVNDTYRKRTARKFTNEVCRACKVYPLCFGGCSQKQMSRFADACVMHYTEENKLRLIKQRIRALSESFHKQN